MRVKEICKEQGITLKDLAKRMGITYQSLHRTVKGNPTKLQLEKIARALDVTLPELFEPPIEIFIKYQNKMLRIGPKQIRKLIQQKEGPL